EPFELPPTLDQVMRQRSQELIRLNGIGLDGGHSLGLRESGLPARAVAVVERLHELGLEDHLEALGENAPRDRFMARQESVPSLDVILDARPKELVRSAGLGSGTH